MLKKTSRMLSRCCVGLTYSCEQVIRSCELGGETKDVSHSFKEDRSDAFEEPTRMDIARLKEQYLWIKEKQMHQTRVVLFQKAPSNEEICGKSLVNMVPVNQEMRNTKAFEEQLPVKEIQYNFLADLDNDKTPWRTHLGIHRMTHAGSRIKSSDTNVSRTTPNPTNLTATKKTAQLRLTRLRLPFTVEFLRYELKELAGKYASFLGFPLSDVESALETIRSQAVKRGEGNNTYKETCVATLELNLPKDVRKDNKKKNYLETKLDITAQDLMNKISEMYGLKYIKLILNGRTLNPDKRLDEQNMKHNAKVMVLKVSEPERKKLMKEEEEKKRSQNESVKRTKKGFQILSERDGTDDPETTPFLEIADQKGNPLKIPPSEKKALILAMGFHEKGRALMKRKEYDAALCHLLQADDQFGKCGSMLLNTVDNYAVLQLDIVWCYRALEALSCLDDGKQRLQKAEGCFLKCYGEQQERLLQIKGNTGREEVLFLRLYLLQSLLSYLDGNEKQAAQKLVKVEDLYGRLCLDPNKMTQLMSLGYTEQEARLGLRACQGNTNEAALHISQRRMVAAHRLSAPHELSRRTDRMEKKEMKQQEREKRRLHLEAINTLVELGYSKKDAAQALNQTDGHVDRAFGILLDTCQPTGAINNNTGNSDSGQDREAKIVQLTYLGFEREIVEAALRRTSGNVQLASQMILDNQGNLPPDLPSPSPPSSLSEEPSTSSESAGSGRSIPEDPMDVDLVNEVLEDIPRHEEDYLDLTLEEEGEVIAKMKSYLEQYYASSS
ncbi:hypothetical protein AAFF_G00003060 [Aldrovandia affinis]|uniref:UBA domain-containing protein n=1 Tax=Aldrovandia affinis TaxID=143900 RepID=A0AAD7TDU5_9TELE|nr:hypothetical protein AAFF_G00003060 [Aldrovandia affinis]